MKRTTAVLIAAAIEHGFEWGGDWEDRKDYQHFEIPTSVIAEWYPDNQ